MPVNSIGTIVTVPSDLHRAVLPANAASTETLSYRLSGQWTGRPMDECSVCGAYVVWDNQ